MKEAAWSEDLQCHFESWQIGDPRELILRLPADCCCDMTGAIKVAKSLLPDVDKIIVMAGGKLDVLYAIVGKNWKCADLRVDYTAARH